MHRLFPSSCFFLLILFCFSRKFMKLCVTWMIEINHIFLKQLEILQICTMPWEDYYPIHCREFLRRMLITNYKTLCLKKKEIAEAQKHPVLFFMCIPFAV